MKKRKIFFKIYCSGGYSNRVASKIIKFAEANQIYVMKLKTNSFLYSYVVVKTTKEKYDLLYKFMVSKKNKKYLDKVITPYSS